MKERTLVLERKIGVRHGLCQGLNNAVSTQYTEVNNVSPFGDSQCSVVVLLLDSVANIDELSVFKDHEIVFKSQRLQSLDGIIAKIPHHVDMCLEDGDVQSDICRSIS